MWNTDREEEIERVLQIRHDDFNAFWLSLNDQNYPAMLVLVKGNLASLHYFPKDRDAGLRSIGAVEGLDPGGMSNFNLNGAGEIQEVLNDSIVPFQNAVGAAKEFAKFATLPRSIEWFEL